MGVAVEGHDQGEMTLVFALSALRELDDPAAAIADAREWSRYVAVVGRNEVVVESFLADHDIDPDFEFTDDDKWETMERLRTTTPTPRHVFVGVTDGDRTLASHLDWEYRPVSEAASKADWGLAYESDEEGLFSRVTSVLPFGGE